MFSINLSLLNHSNYVPDGHIVNLKQLSENTVRIQIAQRTERDKLPVVHANSRKFASMHEDSLVADVTMSYDDPNVIIRPKNFAVEDNEALTKKRGYNILDTLSDIVHIIVKQNEMEVTPGYQLQNR